WDVVPGRPAQRFFALRADQERRVRMLYQRRRQGCLLPDRPVLAAMDEVLVRPDAADDVEGFEEHLARLLLVDPKRLELRRTQAAAKAHVEAPAGQIVEHRRLLGDEQRMPERQDVDHAAEADMAGRA